MAVALALAGALALVLVRGGDAGPEAAPGLPAEDAARTGALRVERERREADRQADKEAARPVRASGEAPAAPEAEIDVAQAEIAMANGNRQRLIAENVASLEAAAAQAEAAAQPERAELMYRRIELLKARAQAAR
ncbi:MAG: hypothetical protein Q8P41_06995 [Pseudomonadota bacterium]|nr:hypothetical protein [Pseudomonadota bacterium]